MQPPVGKDDIGFAIFVCVLTIIGAGIGYAVSEFLWKLFLKGF